MFNFFLVGFVLFSICLTIIMGVGAIFTILKEVSQDGVSDFLKMLAVLLGLLLILFLLLTLVGWLVSPNHGGLSGG